MTTFHIYQKVYCVLDSLEIPIILNPIVNCIQITLIMNMVDFSVKLFLLGTPHRYLPILCSDIVSLRDTFIDLNYFFLVPEKQCIIDHWTLVIWCITDREWDVKLRKYVDFNNSCDRELYLTRMFIMYFVLYTSDSKSWEREKDA